MSVISKNGVDQFATIPFGVGAYTPNTTEELRSAAVTVIERVWITKNDPESAKTWLSYLGLTAEINRRDLEETVTKGYVPSTPQRRPLSRGQIKTWTGTLPR